MAAVTWSAEELFVRAYGTAAVAVQAVLDAGRKLNELTRPPRRTGGFGEDAVGEYLGGAEQLAEREAEEECSEPTVHHSPRDWTDVRLGHYNVHIEDGQPYRFGRDIKVGEQYCAICGDLLGAGYHTCPVLAAQRASADDTPNPTEPGLDDSELVAVRGLLQERYGRESIGCICPPGLIGRSVACRAHDGEDGEMLRAATGMLQKMTSAPVKSTPGTGAGSDPSPTIASAAPQCAVDGEGPSDACDIPPSPSEGRPTSELLIEAAKVIDDWAWPGDSGDAGIVRALVTQLHDRAATFVDIEQDK